MTARVSSPSLRSPALRSRHIAPQARAKSACLHACPPPAPERSYYRHRYHACYRNDRTKLFHASPSHPMLRLCVHRHSPQARCCPATAQAKNDRRTTSKPPSVANIASPCRLDPIYPADPGLRSVIKLMSAWRAGCSSMCCLCGGA